MNDDVVDTRSKNSSGHRLYPKLVYPHGPGTDGVRVFNIQQEQKVLGVEKQPEPKQDQPPQQSVETKPAW
jgi:hypothetical protein